MRAEMERRTQEELVSERPIEVFDSVWIEELTWMEVRDAMAEGKTTAIITTGGIEQNGPYLATGKHNYPTIMQTEQDALHFNSLPMTHDKPFNTTPLSGQAPLLCSHHTAAFGTEACLSDHGTVYSSLCSSSKSGRSFSYSTTSDSLRLRLTN